MERVRTGIVQTGKSSKSKAGGSHMKSALRGKGVEERFFVHECLIKGKSKRDKNLDADIICECYEKFSYFQCFTFGQNDK